MSPPPASPASARRRRRWPKILGLIVLAMFVLVASVPLLLNTPAGNRLILTRLNRTFAPGQLRVDAIRVSWSTLTELEGVRLDDPRGKTVLTAPTARLSASLWKLIVWPGRLGWLSLNNAAFEVSRIDGGGIDLADALGSIVTNPDPRRELKIDARGASLVVSDRGRRVLKGRMDLFVEVPAAPGPLAWTINIHDESEGTLEIVGEVDRWRARPTSRETPDLTATFRATRWPLAGQVSGIELAAELGGRVRITRTADALKVDALTDLASIRADGPALKGDTLRLASLAVECSLGGSGGVWSVDHFAARSPLGNLTGAMMSPDEPVRLAGTIDLAAIAAQLPHAIGLRDGVKVNRGTATIDVATRPGAARSEWAVDGKIGLADLSCTVDGTTRDGAKIPISMTTRSVYNGDRRSLQVDAFEVATPYGSAQASGNLSATSVDLTGTISPDWSTMTKILADRVEPGAKLMGGPHGFRIKRVGDSLDVEAGLSITEADLFGMKLGATPIVVHAKGGTVTIDPIATTLNEGRLTLAPRLDMDAPGGPTIRLGKESGLTGAVVNEEVSRRVLSYVAPILDRTTRASGRVSMAIDDASFPLIKDVGSKAVVNGSVVFQDLQFSPGPLARQMYSLVSAREPETIRLDEPVFLTIAEGGSISAGWRSRSGISRRSGSKGGSISTRISASSRACP